MIGKRCGQNPETMSLPEWILSVGRLVALFAGLYVFACFFAHYYGQQTIFRRVPPNYSLGSNYVKLTTPDGFTLAARHWPNPEAKFTLLYFHGNGEELGGVSSYIAGYVRAGFAVFAYDYRGYGHSGGASSESASYADAKLALEWLRENGTPPERVIAYGYSLGSGSAVELARTEPLAGLILESAFVSAYRVMTRWPILLGDKFSNERKLPDVHCPVLLLHGTADTVIPHWHSEVLFAAANEPKRLWIVPGAGHGGIETTLGDRFAVTLREFAASLR